MSSFTLSDKHRKLARSLHLRKHRDEEQLFIAEGEKVVVELLRSSLSIEWICVDEARMDSFPYIIHQAVVRSLPLFSCTSKVFASISETPSPQGVVAIARMEEPRPVLGDRVVALDGLQDPGNVGTIVRTAHFFAYDCVLLGTHSTDRYNGKFIRSCMGSCFHIPCVATDLRESLEELRSTHTVVGADAHARTSLHDCILPQKHCIVIGSEGSGISPAVERLLHERFVIAGGGGAESLNASVAAGICLHHFAQRRS
jgi:TrmH family RNA methyltransferase